MCTYFLVGETMEWTSKAVHTSGKGEVGVTQGGSHQVDGVGRHVATFVVAVDCQVQPHEFDELGVVVAQHLGEVVTPILGGVDGSDSRSVPVGVTVDGGGDDWQFGDQVHGVFVGVLPVFGLVHTA